MSNLAAYKDEYTSQRLAFNYDKSKVRRIGVSFKIGYALLVNSFLILQFGLLSNSSNLQ
jgi:hypothetical protein